MNENARTGLFLAIGAVMLVAAFLARPAQPERMVVDDSGERFFESFDPLDATRLEILAFDADDAQVRRFEVARQDGRWTIPSHAGYPADAADQLARAAASVADLIKGPVVSDSATDHALYGVLDPAQSTELSGVGTRVTLSRDGATLVDFIIGGVPKDERDLRFVRVPGRDRVYMAEVDTRALSTSFQDWIEDDLLQLDEADLRTILVNDYTVDEIEGRIIQGDVVELQYDDAALTWTMPDLAEGEAVDDAKVAAMRQALDDLRIINVEPKPEGLARSLRESGALQLDQESMLALQTRGYYVADNTLVSNQGETILRLANGIVYTLRFGEITMAGDAVPELLSNEEPSAADDEGASRYLFIMAGFAEDFVDPAVVEPLPELPEGTPAEAPEGVEEDDAIVELRAERERVRIANERRRRERAEAIDAAREEVERLNDRFANWFYVIADDVYRRIRTPRGELVTEASAAPSAGAPGEVSGER